MLAYLFRWSTSLLLITPFSTLVTSTPLPNDHPETEPFKNGPYALRLVSTHPNLTNTYLTTTLQYKNNPDPKTIQPVWAGASPWQEQTQPNVSINLYETSGSIFLDERMSNRESPQLVLKYTYRTVENPHTPYLDWTWEAGPGVTHVWPALWYVTWGGFRFVRQKGEDEGRVFLFYGDGTDPRWRLAAEYAGWADAWYMNSWNSTDPTLPLPKDWVYVNVEVVPFGSVGI